MFIRNLLIRPPAEELASFVPELTIVDMPSFRADPKRHGARMETIIACDFTRTIVLIGGTSYAGEMKKSVFTVLNYLLPAKQVMPMHCSANTRRPTATRRSSSASPAPVRPRSPPIRSARSSATTSTGGARGGIFNFEGGCYAKAIKLSREAEPEIYATTERFGSVHGERDARSKRRGFPTSTTNRRPRIRASPIRSISSPTRRRPGAPVIPRTSSC